MKYEQISYSTSCFPREKKQDDLLFYLEMLKLSGINKVELSRRHFDFAYREQKIKDIGIEIIAVHGTLGYDIISDSKTIRQKALDNEMKRMDDIAQYSPCPYVIHYLDRTYNSIKSNMFRKSIEFLAQYNQNIGLTLAIETVPHKAENERYPNSLEIADFVKSFNSKNIQMTIDINHSNINENLCDVIKNCKNLISHIHVSDNHGLFEEHLIPGQGNIDIKLAMQKLYANNYVGPCNLEMHLDEDVTVATLKNINETVFNILK